MKLRVSANRRLTMCPFYVALESGYFTDAGFEIELVKDMGTALALPLLAGGKLDASLNSYGPPIVNAIVRGARLRIVAGRELASPSCGTAGSILVTRKQFPEGIQSMRPLKGKRIGISLSAESSFWLDALLEHDGMRSSDVQISKLGEPERMAALRAGGIEAFVTSESDLSPELKELGVTLGPRVSSLMPDFQYSHILFGATLLNGTVDTGARFLRAYFRGAGDFLRGKTPKFMEDYARDNHLDLKLIRDGCRGTFERDGTIHMNDLQRFTDWMGANALCPAQVDAASLVDTRFLNAAHQSSPA